MLFHDETPSSDAFPSPFQIMVPLLPSTRLAHAPGIALCASLTELVLSIVRYRRSKGWDVALLLETEEAKSAVAVGLLELSYPVRMLPNDQSCIKR